MTSKSSFLGSLKENGKRRVWVWAVVILAFVLVLPLVLAMRISLVNQQMHYLTEAYGAVRASEIVHGNLLEMTEEILGLSPILFLFTVIFAVADAVQGFSWLYSRKKIDFYMGMPVKRSKRFLVIWFNGILIYVIPYLLGLLVCMAIAGGNHALAGEVVTMIARAFLVHLLLYLCIYHMALLAVMLTGNMVITGMGFFVFCLYEWVVRRVDYVYRGKFFRYFYPSFYSQEPLFSPLIMYTKIAADPSVMMAQGKTLLGMAVFAVVLGVLSYVCYLKRPAESAGKAMVFPITKPVIKILLVVPMALLLGDLIAGEVNYDPLQNNEGGWYVIVALVLMTVLGSAVIQVLYEFDIKGALHQKRYILISGILVALFFSIYRFDLLHYDSYIPEPEQVESIAFYPSNYEMVDYRGMWFDEDGSASGIDYVNKYMHLKNTQDVCGLVSHSMEKYDQMFPKGNEMVYDDDAEEYWSSAAVIYRMKNGREVVRRVWVDMNDEQTGGYLDRIIGSAEFKEGYLVGASDQFAQIIAESGQYQINGYYGNMVYQQKMRKEELLDVLECYQADMEKFNFTRVKESAPQGILEITFEKEISNGYYGRGTMTSEVMINIYPFFEQSIACLQKYGYYMERQVDVEDIERIYITNRNTEVYQELLERQRMEDSEGTGDMPAAMPVYGDYDIDTRGYADYTDKEDIEKLADYIYTSGMLSSRWDGGPGYDYDYSVLVYFKPDSEMSRKHGTYADYVFQEGNVPDFVQEDTAYQETK